jgi:hypothetical protein
MIGESKRCHTCEMKLAIMAPPIPPDSFRLDASGGEIDGVMV